MKSAFELGVEALGGSLERRMAGTATLTVELARDELRGYEVRIRPHRNWVERVPSVSELSSVLPVGSRWKQALDWRSFVGLPFDLFGGLWAAIGVEAAANLGRGSAFAQFFAYIVKYDSIEPEFLLDLAEEAARQGDGELSCPGPFRARTYIAKSGDWKDHCTAEAGLLRRVATRFRKSPSRVPHMVLFRTLILSEEEILRDRNPKAVGAENALAEVEFWMVAVPKILGTFSWAAWSRLGLRQDYIAMQVGRAWQRHKGKGFRSEGA